MPLGDTQMRHYRWRLRFASSTGIPNPNDFCIADSPPYLQHQSILFRPRNGGDGGYRPRVLSAYLYGFIEYQISYSIYQITYAYLRYRKLVFY